MQLLLNEREKDVADAKQRVEDADELSTDSRI